MTGCLHILLYEVDSEAGSLWFNLEMLGSEPVREHYAVSYLFQHSGMVCSPTKSQCQPLISGAVGIGLH